MKTLLKRVINTQKSNLDIYSLNIDMQLISNCIDEINNNLIEPTFGNNKRSICLFSDKIFTFSQFNKTEKTKHFPPNIKKLIQIINDNFITDFNGVLINKYNDGNDYIHIHSDAPTGIHPIGVLCLSVGASRTLRIHNKKTKEIHNILTADNEIILMGGNFQNEFYHEIPKEAHIKLPRYSFTFRKYK